MMKTRKENGRREKSQGRSDERSTAQMRKKMLADAGTRTYALAHFPEHSVDALAICALKNCHS